MGYIPLTRDNGVGANYYCPVTNMLVVFFFILKRSFFERDDAKARSRKENQQK